MKKMIIDLHVTINIFKLNISKTVLFDLIESEYIKLLITIEQNEFDE